MVSLLRAAALIALPVGAAGSIALMLRTGRRNPSLLLLGLFAVWVLSPFMASLWATVVAKRWTVAAQTALYIGILVLTLVSLAIYAAVALGPPRPQPAFMFLVVPFASLVIIVVFVIAVWRFGRLSPRRDGAA